MTKSQYRGDHGGIMLLRCWYCLKGCVRAIKDVRDEIREEKCEEELKKKAEVKIAATADNSTENEGATGIPGTSNRSA